MSATQLSVAMDICVNMRAMPYPMHEIEALSDALYMFTLNGQNQNKNSSRMTR